MVNFYCELFPLVLEEEKEEEEGIKANHFRSSRSGQCSLAFRRSVSLICKVTDLSVGIEINACFALQSLLCHLFKELIGVDEISFGVLILNPKSTKSAVVWAEIL